MREIGISFEDWFYYDETSPSCLRWKVDKLAFGNVVCKEANSVAGTNHANYWRVGLNGKLFQVSRVIIILMGADLTGKLVDHLDGNPSNNKSSNLRAVEYKTNYHNVKKRCVNTSTVNGVCWHSTVYQTYAKAFWHDNTGKQNNKYFSVLKFGLIPAFKLACDYRNKMIEKLNSQGSDYTERHGQ